MTDDETCSDCGQRVRWVITASEGRRIALNPHPAPDGNIIPTVDAAGRVRARILTGDQMPPQEPAWTRHTHTCTESPAARQRRARAAPRCRACHCPMDPDLARLEKWTEHPCCDTTAHAATARAAITPGEAT